MPKPKGKWEKSVSHHLWWDITVGPFGISVSWGARDVWYWDVDNLPFGGQETTRVGAMLAAESWLRERAMEILAAVGGGE